MMNTSDVFSLSFSDSRETFVLTLLLKSVSRIAFWEGANSIFFMYFTSNGIETRPYGGIHDDE